jgi:hypothetical protein
MAKDKFPESDGWTTYTVRDHLFNGRKATAEDAFNDIVEFDEINTDFQNYEVGEYLGYDYGYSITLRLIYRTKFQNLEIITT